MVFCDIGPIQVGKLLSSWNEFQLIVPSNYSLHIVPHSNRTNFIIPCRYKYTHRVISAGATLRCLKRDDNLIEEKGKRQIVFCPEVHFKLIYAFLVQRSLIIYFCWGIHHTVSDEMSLLNDALSGFLGVSWAHYTSASSADFKQSAQSQFSLILRLDEAAFMLWSIFSFNQRAHLLFGFFLGLVLSDFTFWGESLLCIQRSQTQLLSEFLFFIRWDNVIALLKEHYHRA